MSESVKNYEFNYEYIRAVAPAVSKEEARYYKWITVPGHTHGSLSTNF